VEFRAAAPAAAHPRPDGTTGVAVHSSGAGQPAGRSGGLGLIEGLAGPYASALERPPGRETAPPSRPGGAGPRPAGAFTRPPPGAPRARGCGTSPPAAGAGPAPGAERLAATRPHIKPRHRHDPPQQHAPAPPPHTHRAETTQPLEPHRRPEPATPARRSYYLSPPSPLQLPSRRLDGSPPSTLQTHPQPTRYAFPAPVAAAPPHALPASRLGCPIQVYLAGRGRGVRRGAADPPSSLSPGGALGKHPKAGRRPVALREETHRAKQMEGNTRRETGCHVGFTSPRAAGVDSRSLARKRHFPRRVQLPSERRRPLTGGLGSWSCRIGPGALLRPGPPKNRTCTFQRIRLKQAGEDPLARRRTIRSRSRSVSSAGPFTATLVAASNLSVGSGVVVIFSSLAHLAASARFRARAPGPVSGRLCGTAAWRGRPSRPGFPLRFRCRHSLLGHPIPAAGLGLPHGRLTGHARARSGPRRGYRVPHARAATGVGALYTPGTAVLIPAEGRAQPAPAALPRPVAALRFNIPPRGALLHEASTRVHAIHRSGLPWPLAARVERAALGLLPGLHTPPLPATHAEDGTGHRARTWNYTLTSG
jgi:hypothetical protein